MCVSRRGWVSVDSVPRAHNPLEVNQVSSSVRAVAVSPLWTNVRVCWGFTIYWLLYLDRVAAVILYVVRYQWCLIDEKDRGGWLLMWRELSARSVHVSLPFMLCLLVFSSSPPSVFLSSNLPCFPLQSAFPLIYTFTLPTKKPKYMPRQIMRLSFVHFDGE